MTLCEEVRDETGRERSIPVLETERLTLRAPSLADVKAIALIANDRRIAENTARIPHPYSARRRRDNSSRRSTAMTARPRSPITLAGAVIGMCGIDPREEGSEIGYWLGVAHWGHGYATETVRALIDYAFGELES